LNSQAGVIERKTKQKGDRRVLRGTESREKVSTKWNGRHGLEPNPQRIQVEEGGEREGKKEITEGKTSQWKR